MHHHLDVGSVLNIVTIYASDLAIDDEILGMESPERRTMIIDNLEVDVGHFFRSWKSDLCPIFGRNERVIFDNLRGRSSVVHEFDDDFVATASLCTF